MERAQFGTLLKHYRAAAALSQGALADQAGLSLDAISALESGRRGGPRLETARRLCDTLGLVGEDRALFLAAARPEELSASVSTLPAPFPQPVHSTPLSSRDAGRRLLPRRQGDLIGREREVSTAVRLVRQTALLTLVGPGGVGKTRLALRVADEVADECADGVIFVPLASINDPALVGPAIALALGLSDWDTQTPIALLISALQSRHLLLVLDNFEQVGEAALLVADLLAACPRVTVLATSRIPLHLSGEQEFSVPPLAIPTPAEVEAQHLATLQAVPAVTLFIARAQLTDPSFALSPENAGAVAEICRRLDGLPLALELAAARVKILPPVALRARLRQRLHVLTGGPRDVHARQQTLRNTIAWSYSLLSESDQILFARLSVFIGGCSLAAVDAICGPGGPSDTLEGLASLADKSLLRYDGVSGVHGESPRYILLETIHEFAREQLAARGEEEELSRRHARHFTALAEAVDLDLSSSELVEWNARMQRDMENVRAALDWCLMHAEAGESEAMDLSLRLVTMVLLCDNTMVYRGGAREQRQLLLNMLRRPQVAAYPHARAQALLLSGMLAERAGAGAQADELYEEALTLARATGNALQVVVALVFLGMGRTDPSQRRADLEEALDLARETVTGDRAADEERIGLGMLYLAVHYLDVGNLSESRSRIDEVYTKAVEQGNLGMTHMALDVLAHIARAEGDTATARRLFEESLTLRRATGDKHAMGHILRFLGEIAEEQGDIDQAEICYAEALTLLRDAWDVNRVAAVLRGVAALAQAAGSPARALRIAGAVNVVHARCGTRIFVDVAPAQKLWARTSWEQIGDAARHAMSPADAAAAWSQGQAMSLETTIAYALDCLPTAGA